MIGRLVSLSLLLSVSVRRKDEILPALGMYWPGLTV